MKETLVQIWYRIFGIRTQDGYRIWPGSKIWVRSNIIDTKSEPTSAVVGRIDNQYKVTFDKIDKEGYIGAKLTSVFKKKENAYFSEEYVHQFDQ